MLSTTLRWEAQALARHLLKCSNLPERLARRYQEANQKLMNPTLSKGEQTLLDLWHRYPILFPFLEAAHAFPRKDSILRRKALIMLALLETDPEFFVFFEEKPKSLPFLFLQLLWEGITAIFKIGIGYILCASRGIL